MHSYFMRRNILPNVANSATKIPIEFRIAKQKHKMSHIMRRFYIENVESPLWGTKRDLSKRTGLPVIM